MQARTYRGAGFGQFEHGGVRIVDLQLRLARSHPQQKQVGGQQDDGDDGRRAAAEQRLDEADAVIGDGGQDDEAADGHHEGDQPLLAARLLAPRQPFHAGLQRLQVHDVEQRDVRNQRRQDGVLHHLHVGDAHVLHHQEGRCAHHRRHDLAVDRGRHLHRAGLVAAVAHALHQRNGEGAGGHHVGDRRAGDDASGRRRHHRRLGRPPAHVAQQRERALDEVVAGAGFVEQRAEQHEQEDEAAGHAQRDAEYALGGEPEVRGRPLQRGAAVRQHVGHVGPGKGVDQEQRGHDDHGQAQHAASGLQQQDDADDEDVHVHLRRAAGPGGQLAVEQEQVAGAEGTDQRHHPIGDRHPIGARALAGRIGHEAQEHGERQMDGTAFGVVEDAHAQRERQR